MPSSCGWDVPQQGQTCGLSGQGTFNFRGDAWGNVGGTLLRERSPVSPERRTKVFKTFRNHRAAPRA